MPAKPPNILIIQADQCAAPALPTYGHPVVKAPNLTTLGENGVIFENAYCNSPLCAPSRFSMLTGQLPSHTGVYDNASEMPSQIPTFAHYLRHLGYQTILCGKMHFVGADQLHGFEERLTTDIYPADFTWTPDWEHPERIQEWYHNMFSVVTAGQCAAALDLDYDDEVAFQGVRKLYDLARSADERPFCMVVSFTHPHDPYLVTPEYWQRYTDEEIDMPKVAPPYDQLDAHSRRLLACFAVDEYTITEQHIRDARHGYYSAISYIDDKVGQLLDALKATGRDQETIVIFTSDHGDMLGEHSLWYKMSWLEWSARVPLIVHAPHRFAPKRVAAPVSLLDLLPTLVDLATDGQGVAWAAAPDGDSLVELLTGAANSAPWDDRPVIGEYLAECVATPLLMIREGRYKYIYAEGDLEQIYDLAADPDEVTNLAAQPAYAALCQQFQQAVAQRWHIPQLRQQVIESQHRRRLVADALLQGKPTYWDFQPRRDASQEYVRNHMEFWELYKRTRFPYAQPPQPTRLVTRYANLPPTR